MTAIRNCYLLLNYMYVVLWKINTILEIIIHDLVLYLRHKTVNKPLDSIKTVVYNLKRSYFQCFSKTRGNGLFLQYFHIVICNVFGIVTPTRVMWCKRHKFHIEYDCHTCIIMWEIAYWHIESRKVISSTPNHEQESNWKP